MPAEKQILLRRPFNEQYTIEIDSEVNGVDVSVTSTVQMRYDLQVLKVTADYTEIRLVQLDNLVLKANNPLVREVAQVSQVFGRMYNELHLKLDPKGNVLHVLNQDLILSKWKQTKAEMEKFVLNNDDLRHAIILNDEIFNSPEKVKIAVEANEFLNIYFGQVYGVDLPAKVSVPGSNIFNTAKMDWIVDISTSISLPPANGISSLTVSTRTEPKTSIDAKFNDAAYSQFKDKIDIATLNPKLYQDETRIVEYETGRIQEAQVSKIEVADEKKLFNKLRYTLKSDSGIVIKSNARPAVVTEDKPKEEASAFRFF